MIPISSCILILTSILICQTICSSLKIPETNRQIIWLAGINMIRSTCLYRNEAHPMIKDDYEKYTDEALIQRLRGGETGISDHLLEKYKGIVRKKARAMYLIGGETDDLIQEGMLGLFKAIQDYRPDRDTSFRTFALLCMERQMYSAIQGSNRRKHQPLNSYVSLSEETVEEHMFSNLVISSPESIIIDRETASDLEQRIHQCLSPFENHVLESYMRGHDYLQIAEEFEKSPKSIDNALQRIRKKVRRTLSETFSH